LSLEMRDGDRRTFWDAYVVSPVANRRVWYNVISGVGVEAQVGIHRSDE
jgi:hypothetical protein